MLSRAIELRLKTEPSHDAYFLMSEWRPQHCKLEGSLTDSEGGSLAATASGWFILLRASFS